MISVRKDFSTPPTGLLGDTCLEKIRLTLTEKNNHKFQGYYYRDHVIESLRIIYNNKCAYCETLESPGSTLRVDHYRPKDKVKGTNPLYDGYYWLGYEWTNLILSCEKCNRVKSNSFPLENEDLRIVCKPILSSDGLPNALSKRADLSYLKYEKPLLLNPEIDEVERHLIFLPNGTIKAITPNGEKSIELYDLAREPLNIERKKIVDKVVFEIKKLLVDYLEGQIDKRHFYYFLNNIYSKMTLRTSPEKQYSRMAFFAFTKFDLFIIKQLEFEGQKQIIEESFNLFRKNALWPYTSDID